MPYQTGSPTQTPTVIPALTEIILPTPTTYTYTVVQGDTFISIAQKTGVTLQALQAANPGVSATALSVGTKLVIPDGHQVPGEPTPTAARATGAAGALLAGNNRRSMVLCPGTE